MQNKQGSFWEWLPVTDPMMDTLRGDIPCWLSDLEDLRSEMWLSLSILLVELIFYNLHRYLIKHVFRWWRIICWQKETSTTFFVGMTYGKSEKGRGTTLCKLRVSTLICNVTVCLNLILIIWFRQGFRVYTLHSYTLPVRHGCWHSDVTDVRTLWSYDGGCFLF